MASPIIITIPKNAGIPAFRDYVGNDGQSECMAKGRKRRLDHLSWDEKMQRKKLKNRVAAQTSRDRKKAKMEEMEDTVKELYEKNEALMKEYRKLQSMNKRLINENADLQNKLSSNSGCCQCKNSIVDCKPSTEPAVFTNPLPQGKGVQSATILNRLQTTSLIANIILTYLLYQTSCQTSTQNSTLTDLKNSLKVYCKKSPQIWKQFLQKERIGRIIHKKITQEKWWGPHQSNWNPVHTHA